MDYTNNSDNLDLKLESRYQDKKLYIDHILKYMENIKDGEVVDILIDFTNKINQSSFPDSKSINIIKFVDEIIQRYQSNKMPKTGFMCLMVDLINKYFIKNSLSS